MELSDKPTELPDETVVDHAEGGYSEPYDAITDDGDGSTQDVDDALLGPDDDALPEIVDTAPPVRIAEVAASIGEDPNHRRFSSSDSVRREWEQGGDYGHDLWLPKRLPDAPERPGLLRSTAYLTDRGFATSKGSIMDRYHYRTASGVATFAFEGFTPVLQSIGMDTSCTLNTAYYSRNCTIRIAFSSAERTAELGNQVLARSGETLRFETLPPGRYSAEEFIDLMAARKYPLSQEFATPEEQSSQLDLGSHDVIQHAPAVMAFAGTQALDLIQQRAQQLADGRAPTGVTIDRARGQFMRDIDGTLNCITVSGMLRGESDAIGEFKTLLGLPYAGNAQPYLDEVLENIRQPATAGRLVLPRR